MSIRNCRRCGMMFESMGQNICSQCYEKDEADFKRVKDFLDDNRGSTIMEISKACEISTEKIKTYMREGRIEIVTKSGEGGLACSSCGKEITMGRLCQKCNQRLMGGLKEATAGRVEEDGEQKSEKVAHTAHKEEEKSKGSDKAYRFLQKD